jgi:putative tryptophan/tyrosine transport system substrate-binding protein
MDRRRFLLTSVAGVLATPVTARAQPAGRMSRVGFMANGKRQTHEALRAALVDGLRDLAWVEGKNLAMEDRWADGDLGRHPRLATELAALNVDVIVLAGTAAARAAIQATRTIPIVVTAVGDPVAAGLVRSLARPGANLTGLAWQAGDLVTKQMQLLREMVPTAARLAALFHAANPTARAGVEVAARSLGVKLEILEVGVPADIPAAFEAAQRGRAEAVIVLPSPMFYAARRRLAELAARHRVPTIYEVKEYVQEGGLASYGPSFPEMYRRAATYVDKILKGAAPGELPMEQPTKFELAINIKTARALGLTIPPSLVVQAEVIE